MHYQVKLFTEVNGELKKIWLNVENESFCICFNSFAWIQNYISSYKEYRKNLKLRIIVVFLNNQPVCIFPFEIINKFKTNILQWACDLKSDFNAPIQKKNFSFQKDSFIDIWKKIIKLMPEIDLIYLKKQINYFEETTNPFIAFLGNFKEGVIYQIDLPQKWSYYTNNTLKKKFYSDLIRTKRLIRKEGKVEFHIAKNSEERSLFIDELIKQKKEKLKKNIKNSFTSEDLNFYKNLEKWENRNYAIQISSIKLNSEFIAIHWGVFNKNYYHYLLPSMKEKNVKQFSPGKLLLSLLIRWSISKKIKFFDFGFGEESYKKKWSNKKIYIFNYIKPKSLNGVFVYIFLIARQIIKKLKNNNN